MSKFSIEYEKDGKQYDRHIEANDFEHAEKLNDKIPIKGSKVTGKLIHSEDTDLDQKLK